jgi:hypothetical protein
MHARLSGETGRRAVLAGICLCFGIGTGIALDAVEHERPAETRAGELSYLPKGEYLKVAVLGYRQAAGDLIWLRAVQHLGEMRQTEQGYRWAYHAIDVVTDLDPQFWFAYLAGGTVLSVWGGMVSEGLDLLIKGMRHNPEVWQLPFYAGYDYFYEMCDSASGAQYLKIAASLPGAPSYLPKLVARLSVEAGDHAAAVEFLEEFIQRTQDERLREALTVRLKEVIFEREVSILEDAVKRFARDHGRYPSRIEDLLNAGIIARVPTEPFGGTYRVSQSDGSIQSTERRERLRVYRNKTCLASGGSQTLAPSE